MTTESIVLKWLSASEANVNRLPFMRVTKEVYDFINSIHSKVEAFNKEIFCIAGTWTVVAISN